MTAAPDTRALYHTAAGHAALQQWYDAAISRIERPTASRYLPTTFGPTHVLSAGDPVGVPLVLLPTWGAHAGLLSPLIAGLRGRWIVAVDPPGHTGRSAPTLLDPNGSDYGVWLGDVLAQLGVAQADLVGHGYGAWTAIRAAAQNPQRVRRVALLSPTFFGSVGLGLLGQVAGLALNPFTSQDQKIRQFARGVLAPPGVPFTPELGRVAEWFGLLITHARYPSPQPAPPRGLLFQPPVAQLALVRAPTLVLVGEHEVMYAAGDAVRLARAALPALVAAEVIVDAGHALYHNRTDAVCARIGAFADG